MSAWTISMVLRLSDDGFRISLISGAEANIVKNGAKKPNHLGCRGTRYVRHARGRYAYGGRTVQRQAALRRWYVQHAGGWHA